METLRFRSIPLDQTKHLPRRSAILSKQYNEEVGEKNCYIVMKTEEEAKELVGWLNSNNRKETLGGEIVKVTLADNKDIDIKHSVFLGNLPFGLNVLISHFYSDTYRC